MDTPLANLPSGTVTFLFTDIEGSTNLAQQYPDALPVLLERHNVILRRAIQSNHGITFRMAGDAFCAAFHTPGDALAAALTAQRELQNESWTPVPVLVRMGLHTGEARTRTANSEMDPYIGYLTLTRVQRVMSIAHGGQVLLSDVTASLVRDTLAGQVTLRDLGEHKLKGLAAPEPIWQLVAPDLKSDFEPLQSLDMVQSNLPRPLSRLIGRTREIGEVKERLEQTRLLTLLGPGGTGKTRLALEVAADVCDEFEDRVYFVDLAASRDPESVLVAIGRTIGLREKNDRPLLDELKEHIDQKRMLSVLDNFEQVTVAGPTMADLLRDCPGLRMLVTSREALHVRGEQVYPVPPLTLPSIESRSMTLEQLSRCEAIQLFMERAQAVRPDLELTNENAEAIAEICMRLDGLPLAIELATARLNVLTPQALAERLGNRLKLLRGGAQDLPERHQTLSDTIEWSYEMLTPGEQNVFKSLAVFNRGNLDAIESVVERIQHPGLSGVDILEGVSELVDKSLLRQIAGPEGETRLGMLETIREYAALRLEEDASLRETAKREHAAYFADFTLGQLAELRSTGRERAIERLTLDLENIQSAWRYWAAIPDLEQLGKFTDTLWLLYDARGWYHDTVQLTTDLLRVLESTVSTPERAREEIVLQTGLARALMVTKGYTEAVEQAYARALELCEMAGEIPQLYPVMRGLATLYILRDEHAKAVDMGRRMLELGERLDDPEMRVAGHLVTGENLVTMGDFAPGLEHLGQAIALYESNKGRASQRSVGSNAAVVARIVSALALWMQGYSDRARKLALEAIELAHKLDHPFSLAYALYHNAFLAMWLKEYSSAHEHARAVMDLADEYDFQLWSAAGACVRGAALVELGVPEEGLALIERGVAAYRGPKSPPVFLPLLLLLNARACLTATKPALGMQLLDEAIGIGMKSSDKTMASELLSLKGELILAISPENVAEAEGWLQSALRNAQEVGAVAFELRSALPLSQLWQTQGKLEEARVLLDNVVARYTEGFETLDLKRARELLAGLSRES